MTDGFTILDKNCFEEAIKMDSFFQPDDLKKTFFSVDSWEKKNVFKVKTYKTRLTIFKNWNLKVFF